MIKVVYGFDEPDIKKLAESLSVVTGIRFHEQQSGMIGPWYSSADFLAIHEAMSSGDQATALALWTAAGSVPDIMLMLNDNGDYYSGGAEFPGQGACLLRVTADPAWLLELEDKLSRSGLLYEEISRSELS